MYFEECVAKCRLEFLSKKQEWRAKSTPGTTLIAPKLN